ncbi:hypothetical protein D3C80_1141960 [compost metagenome]
MATKNAAIIALMYSSCLFQSGAVAVFNPAIAISPYLLFSISLVAMKKTRTSPIPTQNHGSFIVSEIGSGRAPTI